VFVVISALGYIHIILYCKFKSGPLDKGGASTSVFGQNGNRPAAGNFFLSGHLSFLLLSVNC
jgi:hypothetical protein